MVYRDRIFQGDKVRADGNAYRNCYFENCVFVFTRAAPVEFTKCSFDGCRFAFAGAAAMTLSLLTDLYAAGFRELIEQTFDNIRNGQKPTLDP